MSTMSGSRHKKAAAARNTTAAWVVSVTFILLFSAAACALLVTRDYLLSARSALRQPPHAMKQGSHTTTMHGGSKEQKAPSFAVAIASVHRPGNISYLSNTLDSLYCTFNASGGSTSIPPVLVVNGETPTARHTSFAALQHSNRYADARRHKLQFISVPGLHEELHSPAFVSMLAERASQQQVSATQ